jgi:anti-sigma B factor antagonist
VGTVETALTAAVTRPDTSALLVDFSDVTFCDSSGIAALDKAYAAATQRAISFQMINLQPIVRHVLKVTGLLETLTSGRRH